LLINVNGIFFFFYLLSFCLFISTRFYLFYLLFAFSSLFVPSFFIHFACVPACSLSCRTVDARRLYKRTTEVHTGGSGRLMKVDSTSVHMIYLFIPLASDARRTEL